MRLTFKEKITSNLIDEVSNSFSPYGFECSLSGEKGGRALKRELLCYR